MNVLVCQAQNTAFTYQGRIRSGNTDFNGIGQFKFALVTSTNANHTTHWSNDGTSVNGSPPAAAVNVIVSNGLFTVVLGDATQPNMTAIPATIFAQSNLRLRIWFNDGVNGFAALDPAQNLTPVPFAVMASSLPGLSVRPNTNGAPNVVGGSSVNFVSNGVIGATIAGGGVINDFGATHSNAVTASFGTVGGGSGNTVSGDGGVIAGGLRNTAADFGATVGGGTDNVASNQIATVSGGGNNVAGGHSSTVAGGNQNLAINTLATVSGGSQNTASGWGATVPGGFGNIASGQSSFAAGHLAQALHAGSFVWSDDSFTSFASTTNNQFSVRASGGIRLAGNVQLAEDTYRYLSLSGGNSIGYLYGSYPKYGDGIHLGYNYYADAGGIGRVRNPGGPTSRITVGYGEIRFAVGGINTAPDTTMLYINTGGVCANGAIGNCSDRNVKQNFAPISPSEILEKVIHLPLSEWSYTNTPAFRHIGPMAQDFYSAFKVGVDDKQIATVDAEGVALAAIQGLNEKLESRTKRSESEIKELKAENAELKKQLEEIKAAILKFALND